MTPARGAGKSFRADVAVADGMRLPYAAQRFDAVLCIAVLHHMTTPARRREMLRELVRVLAPGGKALVTVWATEQEDMKKLAKWKAIPRPGNQQGVPSDARASGNQEGLPADSQSGNQAKELCHPHTQTGRLETTAPGDHLENVLPANDAVPLAVNAAPVAAAKEGRTTAAEQAADGGGTQAGPVSNDYFVPWHLPFHRAEAAAQVLKSGQAGSEGFGSGIHIDNKKGAVVFSRYYHVFEQFELDRLVQQIPHAMVFDSFYDKDNWCVVMQRTE